MKKKIMKSYTTIEQSRKLAEILPLESADMFLAMNGIVPVMSKYIDDGLVTGDETAIPCWSLAALLEILKSHCERLNIHLRADKKYNIFAVSGDFVFCSFYDFPDGFDTSVDACVAMIEKLHELNLL